MPTLVRPASSNDAESIVSLQIANNGPETEWPVRRLIDEYGPGIFTVAVEGGRVVSTLCLLQEVFCLGGVEFTVGQPEFVATDPEYRGRGLVRAQLEVVHGSSESRGDLAQVIAGIPYFYRQFGYEYAIEFPRIRTLLPGMTPVMPAGWHARDALAGDVAAIMELQATAQEASPLVARRSATAWRRWIDSPDARVLIAESAGVIAGTGLVTEGPPGVPGMWMLSKAAAERPEAIGALLAETASMGRPVAIEARPGTLVEAIGNPLSAPHPYCYALYVRVPDPVALLDRLRPALSERLSRSSLAATSGRLLLSLYRSSVLLSYENGLVTEVDAAPGEQDPVGQGGAGVPPDRFATLVFGRHGARALAERNVDVSYGRVAALMEILFPKVVADLQLS